MAFIEHGGQDAAPVFHLLVDVDEADRLNITDSLEIEERYGIPSKIVETYQGEWLVPFLGIPPAGTLRQ